VRLVSVSGPPGAGKTTLCAQLMEVLGADATLIPDLPREALERLDPTLESWNDPAFQHYVGYAQLLAEERDGHERIRLCDKSLVDAIAYCDVLFDGRRPRWTRPVFPARYALVLLCDHADVVPDPQSLQGLHLALRDPLAQRIAEIAQDAAPRVVGVSGTRSTRLALALSEIDDVTAAAGLGRSRRIADRLTMMLRRQRP
jgi:nicotinamide riboside kinase